MDTRLSEIWLEFLDGLMWSQELELMILLDPFCDLFIFFFEARRVCSLRVLYAFGLQDDFYTNLART